METKLIDLLNKMNNIHYGWSDKYNIIHKHSKKNFFLENYRFMSIEETLKTGVGTCFEQTELIEYYLKQENISCKKYMILYNDPDKIARHTFCVANVLENYYLMESSWIINGESFKFNTLEEILRKIVSLYPKMYKLEPFNKELIDIYEYYGVTPGLNYYEFSEIVKKCNKIDLT